MPVTISINGADVDIDAEDDMPLLWVLREIAGMPGTKFGCGAGLCGACTVHINGEAQFSCQIPLGSVGSAKIVTIEGIRETAIGRVVQQAWIEEDVVQCGYCQPGQIMRASALLASDPDPSEAVIDETMSANICRCGTYPRIRKAIMRAAAEVKS